MCATCYTLKWQDEEYFGGLREQVLKRDEYCCRACGASGRGKRSIVVHHLVPGVSRLHLMISLCPACHAIVSRTRVMRRPMPPLLLELWREQHPKGHEQAVLSFEDAGMVATPVPFSRAQTSRNASSRKQGAGQANDKGHRHALLKDGTRTL